MEATLFTGRIFDHLKSQALDAPFGKFRDLQENTNFIFGPRPLAGLGYSQSKSGSPS